MESLLKENNFQIIEHNNSNEWESNSIKKAQKDLKEIKEGKYSEECSNGLPEKMLKSVLKSYFENLPVVENLCGDISSWVISSSNINGEEDVMHQNSYVEEFIHCLQQQSDFIKCYYFEEDEQTNIWIIIKETGLDNNLKYMKLYREYDINSTLKIILFEEDEEKEILEQLSFISDNHKEVSANG